MSAPAPYKTSHEEILDRMGYHPATPEVSEKYAAMRDHFIALAFIVVDECPPGRETSLALTHLEEALMRANQAVARTTPVDLEHAGVARVLPEPKE